MKSKTNVNNYNNHQRFKTLIGSLNGRIKSREHVSEIFYNVDDSESPSYECYVETLTSNGSIRKYTPKSETTEFHIDAFEQSNEVFTFEGLPINNYEDYITIIHKLEKKYISGVGYVSHMSHVSRIGVYNIYYVIIDYPTFEWEIDVQIGDGKIRILETNYNDKHTLIDKDGNISYESQIDR